MSETTFADPKTAFLMSLIRQSDITSAYLSASKYSNAALEIGILLDRIVIPKNREDLQKLQETFNEEEYINRTRNEVRHAFRVVSTYLNNTYFKGYDAAIGEKDFKKLEGEDNETEF
jgi:hypothetical protein